MSNSAIYVKTDAITKGKAQKVAKELGLNLSTVVNGFLKQFIKTKTLTFSSHEEEETPNEATQAIMKQAEKDYKNGNTSPVFETGEEAVAWLEKQGI